MSTVAEPLSQPQTNPGSVLLPQEPADGSDPTTTTTTDTNNQHVHHHVHGHHHHIDADASSPLTDRSQSQQQQQHNLEAANIAHFDALGHDFDKLHPSSADFADRLSRALRRRRVLRDDDEVDEGEDATSVLDFACGSGQVSRAIAPYVAQLVGVDISPRMVEAYNARANAQGLEPHEMRAVGSLAELQQQQRFDVAVCSMAYHHFASVQDVTRELVEHLKPSGTLAVADIARVEADEGEAPIMAQYEHIVAHTRGFTEAEMRALFEGAGLENVVFERFTSAKREGRHVQFFLATGTKPADA
ncbi:S-adenosyl-L-methionine-dependent methyltransferase [Russula compacta]|nr:S-adenosyl-L-methionine-dependent methyltransferase [Russula compacta]